MGASNSLASNTTAMINTILSEYHIIQRDPDHNLYYLQHRKTDQEYLMRQFNFTDKRACEQLMRKLKKLQGELSGNQHVVELKDYDMSWEDGYCSRFFRVYTLFQYPQRTLEDEISERRLQQHRFGQTQLWSILACCILGLSHLQKKGIQHSALKSSSILLSIGGIIKVSTPFATAQESIYDIALTKRSSKHLYLSPELAKSLGQEFLTPSADPYKSDTWSLGLIILEAGLLEYQDECYRDQWSRIQWNVVANNLQRFGAHYSEQLKKMLQLMLNPHESQRPDWLELEAYVKSEYDDGTENSQSLIEGESFHFGCESMNHQTPRKAETPNIPYGKPSQQIYTAPAPIPITSHPMPGQNPHTDNIFSGTFNHPKNAGEERNEIGQNFLVPNFSRLPNASNFSRIPISQNQFNRLPIGISSTSNLSNSPVSMLKTPLIESAIKQTGFSHLPIRASAIEFTRPNKNIFPLSTYETKTKPDQNLIRVKEDQSLSNFASIELNLQKQANQKENYVEEIYSKGSKYLGQKMDGMRHGEGKFYYQDGGMYDGEWKYNKMDGYGKLYYQSGKLAYEGHWMEDQFCGQGTLYNEDPAILKGPFDFRNLDDIGEFWVKYQGQFQNDLKHGQGTYYLSNGQKMCGRFEMDIAEGPGVYHCVDGRVVHGQWVDNQKVA